MAWTPLFPNLAGQLPLLKSAKTIIERDFAEALAWAFGAGTPGPVYQRIQFTQRHSRVYPLLVIQAATSTPQPLSTGGLTQDHVFDVEIFLIRSISSGNLSDEIDTLAEDLIRYYDATVMSFLSASMADWRANFPASDDAGKLQVWCTNAVFGQLLQSVEAQGEYLHSVAFELQVKLTEAQ
jgi:hypothetical protein